MFDYYRYIAFFQAPWVPEIFFSVFDYEIIGQVFCGKRSGLAVHKMLPEDVEAYKYSISRPGIKYSLYEVTFGTKKKWPYKTGDLLKEV